MGLALRRRTFDIVQGDLETEAFAAINPWRQVPALLTPEGLAGRIAGDSVVPGAGHALAAR